MLVLQIISFNVVYACKHKSCKNTKNICFFCHITLKSGKKMRSRNLCLMSVLSLVCC